MLLATEVNGFQKTDEEKCVLLEVDQPPLTLLPTQTSERAQFGLS